MTAAAADDPYEGGDASLTLVGTGFLIAGQMTAECEAVVRGADVLFYLVADKLTRRYLAALNPNHESLYDAYRQGRPRAESYAEMTERMLAPLDDGKRVCVAFYGHPGVFATPGHEAIRRARASGIEARMLPAISAEDCLFADLEIDPGQLGCQSYEASYFVLRRRRFDPDSLLVLWQAGGIGVTTFEVEQTWNPAGLDILAGRLMETYPAGHEVIVYRTTGLPMCAPQVERIPLARLRDADIVIASTLLVPPRGVPRADPRAIERLGIPAAPARGQAGTVLSSRDGSFDASAGRLTVVGLGYRVAGQVTRRARKRIAEADRVFYLVTDPVTGSWLQRLNPRAESLFGGYREGEPSEKSIAEMVRRIRQATRAGEDVLAAFTGHPAIFLHMAHEAMAAVRADGGFARMWPGVSFEDCLIADLGLDPARQGRSLFEATDFVTRPRTLDTTTALVLLQPGVIGMATYRRVVETNRAGLELLTEVLRRHYPPDHPVLIYQAAQLPILSSVVHRVTLERLPTAPVTPISTLYLPPLGKPPYDQAMKDALAATLDRARSAKVAV